jgi:hypothetical protein
MGAFAAVLQYATDTCTLLSSTPRERGYENPPQLRPLQHLHAQHSMAL